MTNDIEAKIKELSQAIQANMKAGDALQISQAMLNLAHAASVFSNIGK